MPLIAMAPAIKYVISMEGKQPKGLRLPIKGHLKFRLKSQELPPKNFIFQTEVKWNPSKEDFYRIWNPEEVIFVNPTHGKLGEVQIITEELILADTNGKKIITIKSPVNGAIGYFKQAPKLINYYVKLKFDKNEGVELDENITLF